MAGKKDNDSYVWISYADLMTSVTFAFIFLLLCFLAANAQLEKDLQTERGGAGRTRIVDLVTTQQRLGKMLEGLKEKVEKAQGCEGVLWEVDSASTSIRASFKDKNQLSGGEDRLGWFDNGKAELLPRAKTCLKTFSVLWLSDLYLDQATRDNIQNLVLEGHTNSDKILSESTAFIDNLKLSQDRAYSAAKFIIEDLGRGEFGFNDKQWEGFQKWRNSALTATGRSFAKTITLPGSAGLEDKERSKRIEFRCLIKQDFKAMENVIKESK